MNALQEAFGGWPHDIEVLDPTRFFRWKHMENPRGYSTMLVAESESAVIGFSAWLPMRFRAHGRTIAAIRGVDLAVRPEFRGRGVAAALTAAGAEHAGRDVAFTMSNPNDLSRPGVLRLGRRVVGRVPLLIRVRQPVRTLIRRGILARSGTATEPSVSAPRAAVGLRDAGSVAALLQQVVESPERLVAIKDIDYLRWRYGVLDDYHAVRDERGGVLQGLAIFRVRPIGSRWYARICELFVAEGERGVARRLLRGVLESVEVDYATCHFPAHSVERRAALQSGFVRMPRGDFLVVYPLASGLRPDPTDLDSWALTLGDLELL